MKISENFSEELTAITENLTDTYFYIKDIARYYWYDGQKIFSSSDTASNILCERKHLNGLKFLGVIKTYESTCYLKGGKKGCLNLLNESSILEPSDTPELDKDIEALINNIGGHKKKNIEWINKLVLYKHSHINDFTIPALILFGAGGSGKGTFVSLLGEIFGKENMLANLGQNDISGSFDTYNGKKLVVEFAEITTKNTHSDIRVLNKLKNIVGAEKITVNTKGVPQYQTENIALFIISSNSETPIRLDTKEKGNRRFCLMRSISKLENGKDINKSIRNQEKIKNYLAWLYSKYPEVVNYKEFEALDNEEKQILEEQSQNESDNFWEFFLEKYPEKRGKILTAEIDMILSKYCFSNNLDDKEVFKWFWKTSKYPKRRLRFDGIPKYCVVIN